MASVSISRSKKERRLHIDIHVHVGNWNEWHGAKTSLTRDAKTGMGFAVRTHYCLCKYYTRSVRRNTSRGILYAFMVNGHVYSHFDWLD